MRFSTLLVSFGLAALAAAQTPNPFTRSSYNGIQTGVPINITWTPTTTGTVTLLLKEGPKENLKTVATIQSSLPNDGSFLWTPDATIVNGADYALEIVDDTNPKNINFTPQFSIKSDVTSSAVTSTVVSTSTAESTLSTSAVVSTSASASASASTSAVSTSSATITSSEASSSATSTSKRPTSARTTSIQSAASATSSSKAAATGVKVGAGMMGFIGAAIILL